MLIELGFQDRDDAFAMRRADDERAAARRLQTLFALGLGQVQQPQARSVTLLGVGPVLELPLNHGAGAGADVLTPVQEPPGRPLHVFAMRTWHVLGQRRMPTLLVAAYVGGNAAALEEAFGGRVGEPHHDVLADQRVRDAVA
jgi:hypothetical protein